MNDMNLYGTNPLKLDLYSIGDTFLGKLLAWLQLTGKQNIYKRQIVEGRDLNVLAKPDFADNLVIESYRYKNSKLNNTYVKMYYNGKVVRPFGSKHVEMKNLYFRDLIVKNKERETMDFIRHQRVVDWSNGVVHPIVKYQMPIMIVLLFLLFFCGNITIKLLQTRKGWRWSKYFKKEGDATKPHEKNLEEMKENKKAK